jgi:hypothetical protein
MIRWLSGEFLLDRKANGGTVVLLRAVWIGILGTLFVAIMRELLDPYSVCGFSLHNFRKAIYSAMPAGGGFFAGSYAALYARFASQWTYLAGVYNQIMAAKLRPIEGDESRLALRRWQAGFIADARELHLAFKPMFVSVIAAMLSEKDVRAAYLDANGEKELATLEARLKSEGATIATETTSVSSTL